MSSRVVSWNGRACQDELAGLIRVVVDIPPNVVPDRGDELPLIDETWPSSIEKQARRDQAGCSCGIVKVQADLTPGRLQRRRRLAASPRPFDEDGSRGLETRCELAVSKARTVGARPRSRWF